ncbi:MAG: Ureidoglycolate lyase [Alyxoria varia]|nr:MAG: Ureidoglycolate lyase [Alyxoria varia]
MAASMGSSKLTVKAEPLSQPAFQEFGEVIENAHPAISPDGNGALPPNVVRANQGTAMKHLDVTEMRNFYATCPSRTPAELKTNMFSCHPRKLRDGKNPNNLVKRPMSAEQASGSADGTKQKFQFEISILERHPFTPQTFIPLGLAKDDPDTCYLVICSPTVVLEGESTVDQNGSSPKGPGPPDLARLKAFIAKGSQSVTYAAGTWHAPMVVLGLKRVDFIVVQYCNGVANEDCQEVELGLAGSENVPVVRLNGSGDATGQLPRANL